MIVREVMTLEKQMKSYSQRQMFSALSWHRELLTTGNRKIACSSVRIGGGCNVNHV